MKTIYIHVLLLYSYCSTFYLVPSLGHHDVNACNNEPEHNQHS